MTEEDINKWEDENNRMQAVANELIPTLIGKTLEEARISANEKELPHRVRSIDGKGIGTCDLQPARLNFYVEKNLVTKITLG
jgi:hypothetical protein